MAWRHVGGLISALLIGTSAGCYSGAPEQAEGSEGPSSGDSSASAGEGGDADSGGDADGGGSMAEFEPGIAGAAAADDQAVPTTAIEALLGPGLPAPALEPDTNPYLFFNDRRGSTTLSELGDAAVRGGGRLITRHRVRRPGAPRGAGRLRAAAPGDACVAGFHGQLRTRAYRRPLHTDEQARWLLMATRAGGRRRLAGPALRGRGACCSRRTSCTASSSASRTRSTRPACATPATRWRAGCRSCCGTRRPDDAAARGRRARRPAHRRRAAAEAERLLADPRARHGDPGLLHPVPRPRPARRHHPRSRAVPAVHADAHRVDAHRGPSCWSRTSSTAGRRHPAGIFSTRAPS
jgi:hypothetical protein